MVTSTPTVIAAFSKLVAAAKTTALLRLVRDLVIESLLPVSSANLADIYGVDEHSAFHLRADACAREAIGVVPRAELHGLIGLVAYSGTGGSPAQVESPGRCGSRNPGLCDGALLVNGRGHVGSVNGRLRRLRIVLGPLATLSKPIDVRRHYRHLQPFGDSASFTTWVLEQRARDVRTRNAELMSNGAASKAAPKPEAFLDVQPTAVLDSVRHELLTSPALLFPPFSTGGEAPHSDAVNYAALGSIVGSLLARHLDPVTGVNDLRGVRYGHTWYSEKSEATYLEQQHCVGHKQGSYEGIIVTDKDASENHWRFSTFAQVLAHTVGLRMAYAAFRKSVQNHSSRGVGGGSDKEAAPLGIGASGQVYDRELLFFAAYCFQLCGIVIARHVTRSLPLNARCNLPLRELPEFGNAYNCSNGSAMVPEQTCL
ncbi:hypothetical protein V5799_011774 [Amblyomma americanum]|uniref:Peptidase M13 C-terminal domain-containing protein n=1 Tax=Amblyomma americanum TaxID=6943 RepID=A0AAQ4EG98_AMBAM